MCVCVCVQMRVGVVSRLGLMHLIATNICLWMRAMAVTVAGDVGSDEQSFDSDNNSSLQQQQQLADDADTLYSLLHYNASTPALTYQRIHLTHISTHSNASGQLLTPVHIKT